jgi:flagellar hook assembly protein FlgD
MESSVNSSSSSSTTTTTPSTAAPASSFLNLFLNEVNHQDISVLRDVQRSL